MLKKLAATAFLFSFAISLTPAAFADGEENPWGDYGSANSGTMGGRTSAQTDSLPGYVHEEQGRVTPGVYGDSQPTHGEDANAMGIGQARTGAPVVIAGYNTYFAPANLAYQTEHHTPIGGRLPKTNLDSFVWKALMNGQAERIYGDEGTQGPPPLSDFNVIQSGGVQATTGHPSKAPSAWN